MPQEVNLTIGHVLRHAPSCGGQGIEAALVDIAQDLLLRHLDESGVVDDLAFKGGTALRKLFAGNAGRFSTDMDFSVRSAEEDMSAVVDLLVEAITDVRCGPFRYGILMRRGKPHVTIESDLGRIETLTWSPAHEPQPLDMNHWLRERTPDDFDDDFIGLLASPPPALDELGRAMSAEYGFLRELTDDEQRLASCDGRDKTLLLRMLDELPGTNMPQGTCW